MNPTWYDLLDVEPTASADEIRAAWKSAIADLDPTDRRFRRLSDAAAVLLDPAERESYDASLSSPGAVAETDLHPADEAVPTPGRADANGPERSEDPLASARRPARGGRPGREARRPWRLRRQRAALPADFPSGAAASSVGDLPETEPGISDIEPAAVRVEHDPAVPHPPGPRSAPPLWVLGAAAATALVLVVLAAFAWTRPDPKSVENAADSARAAAERAVVPVLSYDYRSLDAGEKKAESWLTPSYRDKAYLPLFATIKKNAPGTQTVVTTKVVDAAIVRAGVGRVEVLLLVDRPTTNKSQTTPITYEDHVTVTMQRSGDGWLIDGMTT